VGFLLSVLRRHVRKIVLASAILMVCLSLGLGLSNLVQSSGARTVLRRKLTVINSHFLEAACWREAALLLFSGLSLFNGSIPAYSSSRDPNSQRRLIRKGIVRKTYLIIREEKVLKVKEKVLQDIFGLVDTVESLG
jgi:hypothetical protein